MAKMRTNNKKYAAGELGKNTAGNSNRSALFIKKKTQIRRNTVGLEPETVKIKSKIARQPLREPLLEIGGLSRDVLGEELRRLQNSSF